MIENAKFPRLWLYLYGVTLWFPALAIPAGPYRLQLAEVLGPAGLLLALYYGLPSRPLPIVVFMLYLMSFTAALINGGDFITYIYYVLFVFSGSFAFYTFAKYEQQRIHFLKGFMLSGGVSVTLFLLQYFLNAQALDFRNNTNFDLQYQYDRAFALFPEISTFAIFAIALVGIFLQRALSAKERTFKNIFYLTIIFLCLILSASSSFIVVLPLVILATLWLSARFNIKNIVFAFLFTVVAYAGAVTFLDQAYANRGQAASASMSARASTILGTIIYLRDGNLLGAGLGNNGQISPYSWQAAQEFGLQFVNNQEGITSLTFSRMFEEGLLALLQIIICMISLGVVTLRARKLTLNDQSLLIIGITFFLGATLVSGYRGLLNSWLWMCIPLVLLPKVRSGAQTASEPGKAQQQKLPDVPMPVGQGLKANI